MQTGEGKTLAAVPAVIWYARKGRGVHVLTANDYLARRDARWMREIYDWFGLSVGHISQDMSAESAAPRIFATSPMRPRTKWASITCATAWRVARTIRFNGRLHLRSSTRPIPS